MGQSAMARFSWKLLIAKKPVTVDFVIETGMDHNHEKS
jgi:hypothetical protein